MTALAALQRGVNDGMRRLRAARGWLSPLLVGLALYFLLRTIVVNWQEVAALFQRVRPLYLAPAILLTLAMLLLMPAGWRFTLCAVQAPLTFKQAFTIYYRSSIFRYVPGSLWYLPTRAILAQAYGVKLRPFSAAVILELGFLLGAAGVLCGIALASWLAQPWLLALSVVSLLALALLVASPAWLLRRILKEEPGQTARLVLVKAALAYAGVWLAYGLSFYWLLLGFGVFDRLALLDAARVVAATVTAWTAGFVSLSPTGIGVRELSLVGLFSAIMPAAPVLAISLLQRSLELLLELALWVVATLLWRAKRP